MSINTRVCEAAKSLIESAEHLSKALDYSFEEAMVDQLIHIMYIADCIILETKGYQITESEDFVNNLKDKVNRMKIHQKK